MDMSTGYRFKEDDVVRCTHIIGDNVENLVLNHIYTVIGKSEYDGNKVYAVRDIEGTMFYAMGDRFKLWERKASPIMSTSDYIKINPLPPAFDFDKIVRGTIPQMPNPKEIEYDIVSKPKHYNSFKVEVINTIADVTKNLKGIEAVCIGNVIKYVFRYQFKNGVQDLKKAKYYLERVIAKLENGNNN